MGHFRTVSTGVVVLFPLVLLLPETTMAQPVPVGKDLAATDLAVGSAGISAVDPAIVPAIIPAVDLATGRAQTTITNQDQHIQIEGGVQVDNTLFHRFDSFNVESGATADFVTAPTIQSVVGQVSGGSVSYIDGALQISGSEADLYLFNPNGVLFGPDARLNLSGGLSVTTADQIEFGDAWLEVDSTQDYSGLTSSPSAYRFSSENPSAIANQGNLEVSDGQSIRLIAGDIVNTGTLKAPAGEVTLSAVAGGSLVRLDATGALLSLEVAGDAIAPGQSFTPSSLPELVTGESAPTASTLQIKADGTVSLVDSSVDSLVSSAGGSVWAAGSVDVSTNSTEQKGGEINLLGSVVEAIDARLTASGHSGGGLIRVGGDYQGQGLLPITETVFFEAEASADALVEGDGGRVIIWSDGMSEVSGLLSAQAAGTGAGGLVETSGLENLVVGDRTQVMTDSGSGSLGTWLIDPAELSVVAANGTAGIVTDTNSPATASTISASTLVDALNGANITLQATNSLSVNTAIDASNNATAGNLHLQAPTLSLNDRISLEASSQLTGSATSVNLGADGHLQNAVDAVTPNGTVNLATALYRSGETFIDKSLTLQGEGSTNTILDSQGTHRLFNISAGDVKIDGVAVQNGRADLGGGILVTSTDGLTLTNSLIENNVADTGSQFGGGVTFVSPGTSRIANTQFVSNQGRFGGGIRVDDGHTLTVENSRFEDNFGGRAGGAIDRSEDSGLVTIIGSIFDSNGADLLGGAISTGADNLVRIEESTFLNNFTQSGDGGAIFVGDTSFQIVSSTFIGNEAGRTSGGSGGAIAAIGDLVIDSSTLRGNRASGGDGGAITLIDSRGAGPSFVSGNLSTARNSTITNTTIDGNQAAINGGAITLAGRHSLTIEGSTLSDNTAGQGGAIRHRAARLGATLIIENSTLSGNSAINGSGGAVATTNGTTLSISSTTIANNTANVAGGGLQIDSSSDLALFSSIIANNSATSDFDIGGTVSSGGYNLHPESSAGYQPTDLTSGADPQLLPLADNGGPTFTHALRSSSPAINAGSSTSQDQRAVPADGIRDIGAYERSLVNSTLDFTAGLGQTTVVNTAFANPIEVKVTDGEGGALEGVVVEFLRADSTAVSITTDASGIADVSLVALTSSGEEIIRAQSPNTAQQSGVLFAIADLPASITVTNGNNQSSVVDTAFAERIAVQVSDQYGNIVEGAQVSFSTVGLGAAGGTLSNASDITNSTGEGYVNVTANTAAGDFAVLADVDALSTTVNLENIAGIADQFVLSGQPANVTAGNVSTVAITARDRFGNLADTYDGSVLLSISDPQFQTSGIEPFINGVGSFSSEFRTAGIQSLTATDNIDSRVSVTQSGITVNAAAAAGLNIVSGNNQSAVVNTLFTDDLTVQVRDRFNNPIIGEPVSFTVPEAGASASLSQASVLTDATGQATTDAIANDQVGDYTVQVSLFKLLETLRLANTEPSNTKPPNTSSASLIVEPILEQDSTVQPIADGYGEDYEENPGRVELFDERAFTQLEQSLTEEYTRYWQMPPAAEVTLERVQTILQQAQNNYKSRSAIVYAMFVPAGDREASNGAQSSSIRSSSIRSASLSRRILNDERNRDTDQLLLVVIPPEGNPIQQTVAVDRKRLKRQAQLFNIELYSLYDNGYQPIARQLYSWLIAPIEDVLEATDIDELIYVLDEGIGHIPLSALMKGDTFAIERYGLSVLPSVGLLETNFDQAPAAQTVLAGGADVFSQLEPLPGVPIELALVESTADSSRILFNENFSIENLERTQTTLPQNIMHVATHASFRPGALDESYIQFWNEQLSLDDIDKLSLQELELLVLSACRTALGSRDAELGFAGLAAASGVEASIGSLWNISDIGTVALMTEFYERLQANPLRLSALRAAQLSLLSGDTRIENNRLITQEGQVAIPDGLVSQDNVSFEHPFFWSGFTLVGNPWW